MIKHGKSIMAFHHKARQGNLGIEVTNSQYLEKYNSKIWNNQAQPFQNITGQYQQYLSEGNFFPSILVCTISQFDINLYLEISGCPCQL